MSKTRNDLAWEKIFEEHKIIDKISNGDVVEIAANEINKFREARLMTKFDHKSQLPSIFADNKLSILPVTRGSYRIGEFDTFNPFNTDNVGVSTVKFPEFLESLDYRDITSEAAAINCAYVAKILHNFTEEKDLYSTVSGRMSSSAFNFKIKSSKDSRIIYEIGVDNSQLEIDGGYEGDNSLILIEAKNYISDDFLVRQLYYPFRLWSNKIQKKVRSIFLTYSNGIFHLREYGFENCKDYNSLRLVQHKKYSVQDGYFNHEVLSQILEATEIVNESEIPFPQADNFERVINLCELLKQRDFISKEDITQNYDFDLRQTDYYSNAALYLGLIEMSTDKISGQIGCVLSKRGKQIFDLELFERQKEFVRLIISHVAFKETLRQCLNNGEMPSKESIVEIMKSSDLYNINADSTYFRRASTIVGWVNWIINQIEE